MLAAFFGLKCFASQCRDNDILLRIRNATAVACINKMGGIRFEKVSRISKDIREWCEKRKKRIYAFYISSKDNSKTDFESRRLEPETELQLSDEVFQAILEKFGLPEMFFTI